MSRGQSLFSGTAGSLEEEARTKIAQAEDQLDMSTRDVDAALEVALERIIVVVLNRPKGLGVFRTTHDMLAKCLRELPSHLFLKGYRPPGFGTYIYTCEADKPPIFTSLTPEDKKERVINFIVANLLRTREDVEGKIGTLLGDGEFNSAIEKLQNIYPGLAADWDALSDEEDAAPVSTASFGAGAGAGGPG